MCKDGLGAMVCGLPRETSNNVMLDKLDLWQMNCNVKTINPFWISNTRQNIWLHVSIAASNQLRQWTAFTLSQIFAVASSTTPNFPSENFVNYYDIFVQNAFENYHDVLEK